MSFFIKTACISLHHLFSLHSVFQPRSPENITEFSLLCAAKVTDSIDCYRIAETVLSDSIRCSLEKNKTRGVTGSKYRIITGSG